MARYYLLAAALIIILMLSACAAFEDPSVRATENAESTMLWGTVAQADQQAETIVALRSTADSAVNLAQQGTQTGQQLNLMQLTLNAMLAANAPAQATPNIVAGVAVDGSTPAGPIPTPPSVNSTDTTGSTIFNTQGQYVQATTASALTEVDLCAANTQLSFSTNDEIVYFVTVARNISSGTSYSLRVSKDGQVVNRDDNFWVSNDSYTETCIYYGIDGNNITFEAGNYVAELLADGQAVSQANFTILGNDADVMNQ